jgi:hypothetical protein
VGRVAQGVHPEANVLVNIILALEVETVAGERGGQKLEPFTAYLPALFLLDVKLLRLHRHDAPSYPKPATTAEMIQPAGLM